MPRTRGLGLAKFADDSTMGGSTDKLGSLQWPNPVSSTQVAEYIGLAGQPRH